MKAQTLKVNGMHCKSCEVIISDSLGELDGVEHAEASSKEKAVKVHFDESKISLDKIKKAIESEGYEVQ